jgi:TusA-related sulfurtransferase
MTKTRIAFEDVKAGDLLEVVVVNSGVKSVITAIAFQREELVTGRDWKGNEERQVLWNTSEGGMIVANGEEAVIYRIDVAEAEFKDIRKGDRVRVTEEDYRGRKTTTEDMVGTFVDGMNPFWLNVQGSEVVIFQRYEHKGVDRVIEILERGE